MTRESKWPLITTKRSGRAVPRWMATTLTTFSIPCGIVSRFASYDTSRQLPQAAEMRSNSAWIQRRAAPIPVVCESVSE